MKEELLRLTQSAASPIEARNLAREYLQALILQNPSIEALRTHLKEKGHLGLKEVGYRKVLEGKTTIEEVQRVSSIGE